MQIIVDLTEQQEKFLKEFAQKQHNGAEDNRYTGNAFHVVENKRYEYIPYHNDLIDYYTDLPVSHTFDSDYEDWYENEVELIQEYYEYSSEKDCLIEIKPFEEVKYKEFQTVNGNYTRIVDIYDYFKAYGVNITASAWKRYHWEKVAFFFILDEAKSYMKYQKHNLREPRVYTYSAGYANRGDFVPFRSLLLQMGEQLNKEDINVEN